MKGVRNLLTLAAILALGASVTLAQEAVTPAPAGSSQPAAPAATADPAGLAAWEMPSSRIRAAPIVMSRTTIPAGQVRIMDRSRASMPSM